MAREKLKQARVIEAIRKSKGALSVAAEMLGVCRATMYNYTQRYPRVLKVIDDERNAIVDVAELALRNAVIRGEPWAVSLTLKSSRGRDRGWGEQIHIEDNQRLALIPTAIEALVGFAPLPDGAIDISPEETSEDAQIEEEKPSPANGNGHRSSNTVLVDRPARCVNDADAGDGNDWAV